MEFELHKRSEVWNTFEKYTVIWADRELEQGRAIFFNVVMDAIFVGEIINSKLLNRRVLRKKRNLLRRQRVCSFRR